MHPFVLRGNNGIRQKISWRSLVGMLRETRGMGEAEQCRNKSKSECLFRGEKSLFKMRMNGKGTLKAKCPLN